VQCEIQENRGQAVECEALTELVDRVCSVRY